ncbi:MAG: DUF1761 domain-containing protein [Patescibacteria group bacterium]
MNYTYIIIATLAQFVLGALWYSPLMFGKWWMKIMGADKCTEKEIKKAEKQMALFYALQIFLTLVFTFALSVMLIALPFSPIVTALFLLIGFIIPTQISGIIWGPTARSQQLWQVLIVVSNQLVGILLAAFILSF